MSQQHMTANSETTRDAASGGFLRRRLLYVAPAAGFVGLSAVLGLGLTRDPRELPSTRHRWGLYGVPETYVVSADGRVMHKHAGPLTEQVRDATIMPLIQRLRRGADRGSP